MSLRSAAEVAGALRAHGGFEVHEVTIGRPTLEEIAGWPAGVVVPVLHGPWGEGGPMQSLLEASGRAYVGCGPRAARLAMDKMATKLACVRAGASTLPAAVLNTGDPEPPLGLPLIIKPVHEGSSVGLFVCRDRASWDAARSRVDRVSMVEPFCAAREITVGLIDAGDGSLVALPPVEIRAATGVYDFEAKYGRDDTEYVVGPELPEGVGARCGRDALGAARELGVRHLARVDFLVDGEGSCWLMEVNTMPGFTAASLLPKAAAASGLDMPGLCARLVGCAAGSGAV
ncbi:MAG: D-alanine--D-alanine ligase [Planctomycetota bacterium]